LLGWKLSPTILADINTRSNFLGGEPSWIPTQMNFIDKTFKLKAVDFVRASRGAMTYIFAGVFDTLDTVNQKNAFTSFIESLRLCLTTHCNADGKPLTSMSKTKIAKLKEQVVETLSLLEMCTAHTFFDRIPHILQHVPMAIGRWNSCRNFWAFASERYLTNNITRSQYIIHTLMHLQRVVVN
jgi:hypothetical protein